MEIVPSIFLEKSQKKQDVKFRRMCPKIKTSEGKMAPQDQTLFIQKDDLVQKGKLQRHASHEVVHP